MADDPTQTAEPQAPVAPEQSANGNAVEPEAPAVPPEITQRLDELAQFKDRVEPLLEEDDDGPYPGPDPYQESYGQPGQPQGAPQGEDVQWLQDPRTGQYVPVQMGPEQQADPNAEFDQRLEQTVGPLAQRLEAFERQQVDRELDSIVNEFPALQEESAREDLVKEVTNLAAQSVQGLPPDQAEVMFERLRTNPNFVRNAYLAKNARDAATQQGAPADGAQGADLEGGSGASPSPATGDGPSVQEQIMAAGARKPVI